MKISKVYSNVQNGNYFWTLWTDEERNHNTIQIHSNNVGKTIYENDEVWDSDLLKIIRVLKEHEYDRTDLKGMIKKINKVARHLEIPTYITLEV